MIKYYIYVDYMWDGYINKTDGNNITFIEDILKKTQINNFEITNDINRANVLLDSIFNCSDCSDFGNKKWDLKIHFSGESDIRMQKYYKIERETGVPQYFIYKNYNDYDIVITSNSIIKDNVINIPLFVSYINCNKYWKPLTKWTRLFYQNIPEKFCCFIVSNSDHNERNKMFELLNKYKKVDSLGNFNNNMNYIIKEPYWSKEYIDYISQYKFIICFENTKETNYITEKIINGFLARIVPIYWGDENCKKIFNPKSFLYLENENNDECYNNLIETIIELDNDDSKYLSMINQHVFNKDFNYNANYGIDKIAKQIDTILYKNKNTNIINSVLFNVKNKDTYPPFKNGLYLEEYFLNYFLNHINCYRKNRLYIPVKWTNFQIENWFNYKKEEMQKELDEYINNNPSEYGYYTVVQHDDGPLLKLPDNTIVYGACNGNIPIPLIYQDINNTLENIEKKEFEKKKILCSYVGSMTHNIRDVIVNKYRYNTNFEIISNIEWSSIIEINKQTAYINTIQNSKFSLAPRGYGKSSFRFFEILQLGCVPVYIWDDIEWLPYKDEIDYSKICISINIKDIDKLEDVLYNITKEQYNNMITEYKNIKHKFTLDYMCEYIINKNKI